MPKFNFESAERQFAFASTKQLSVFVENEIRSWDWLTAFGGNGPANYVVQTVVAPLQETKNALTSGNFDEATNAFTRYLQSPLGLYGGSEKKKFLDDLAAHSPRQAVYALNYLGMDIFGNYGEFLGHTKDYQAGQFRAIAFEAGLAPSLQVRRNVEQTARAVGEARTIVEELSQLQAIQNELHNQNLERDALHEKGRIEADAELQKGASNLISKLQETYADTESKLSREWQRFQHEITSQLALRAPASYWKDKQRSHVGWVTVLTTCSLLCAVFGALILHEIAGKVFGSLKFNQIPSWFQVVTFSLAALVYVLLLRSCLRLTMSHLHLALDSAERRTMIVSYLALARRHQVKAESLDSILASIFRPTVDGIVKDDGVPLSILTELIRSK